ncbi:MAG: hypothetical protein Q9184_002956 [Pyrenodesmia sp. 2 TL-2023]
MASSPTSATSSDLYAASEPAQELISVRSRGNKLGTDQVLNILNGRVWPVARSSPEGRIVPDAQRSMHEPNLGHVNGDHENPYHKRKRDDELETLDPMQAESKSPGPQRHNHHSHGNGQRTRETHPSPLLKRSLGVKRIKANGHSPAESRPADTQLRADSLPPEIWHHVFRFVPPVFLGRLLRVNRAFHSYLTSSPEGSKLAEGSDRRGVQPLDPETIWAASRKRFAAGLPKPLRGLKELDMWRLLRGQACQLCGIKRELKATSGANSPWEAGPGDQNVRVIWPFGVRSCGPCLEKSSEKVSTTSIRNACGENALLTMLQEVDLLLSSACPSFLLPALPFAFVSSSLNYIPNTLLRESTAPPSSHIVKRFYKPDVRQIKRQLDDVQDLGAASADEWSKGLPAEGKDRINDAIRWEQWEAKGGLKKVNARPQAKPIPTSLGTTPTQSLPKPYNNVILNSSVSQNGPTAQSYENSILHHPVAHMNPQQYQQNHPSPYHVPWMNIGAFQEPPTHHLTALLPAPRPERSIKDANEAKAVRRAEIERRCSLFDPPLLPHILNHMESFQAAIQISTPLTDFAWDVLKPRLLAQRAGAERKDLERVQQNELLQSELKQRRHHDGQSKEFKESVDRHWDSVQAPVRDRLGVLADAAIDQRWSGGKVVTKENCPRFAADILLCARQQFYDEVARAKETAAMTGQPTKCDPPNGPPTLTLTLENMKWLFDTKIKPITENYQRELFLCNACDDNFKFYGFEGVIQHYAAKHTTSLSMGSIVVYWRAEWPDEPPFNPEPSFSKSAHYKVPSPADAGTSAWNGADEQLYHPSSSGYDMNIDGNSTQILNGTSTDSIEPFNSGQATAYSDSTYSATFHPRYPPTSAPTSNPNGLSSAYAQNTQSGHASQWQGNTAVPASVSRVGQDFGAQYAGYNYPGTFGPQGSAPGTVYGAQALVQTIAPRPAHFDSSRNSAAQLTEEYQQQMNEMAKQAREVWYNTSSIKDMPASVRIYVVIHHMAARCAAKFSTVPSLALFLDGLDNNAQMRPVRSLNGLACKMCVTEQNMRNSADQQALPPAGDRRLYTLPHLLNHFRTAHLDGPQAFASPNSGPNGPQYDWTRDMIELPETRLIAELVNSFGLDDNKLELIARAFPGVFPSPLPKLSALRNPGLVPNLREFPSMPMIKDDRSRSHGYSGPNCTSVAMGDGPDTTRAGGPQSGSRPLSQISRLSEPPGEDEYDPHKPTYHGQPGTTGARIGGAGVRTSHSLDGANEWHEAFRNRQLLETTDLSKLLYRATQTHCTPRRPEHGYDQQYGSQPEQVSPTFFESEQEQDESTDIAGPYGVGRVIQHDRYREGDLTGYYTPEGDMAGPLRTRARSPGPSAGAQAAEKILQRLGQRSDVGASHRQQDYGQRSLFDPISHWTTENRMQARETGRLSDDGSLDHAGYRPNQDPLETTPVGPVYSSRHDVKGVQSTSPPRLQASGSYHHANHQRAASNAMITKDGQTSHAYLEYSLPHSAVVEDRSLRNGGSIEQPDNSRHTGRVSQAPHHWDRPRSPVPVPKDPTYYRPRSPAAVLPSQQIYRVRSPHSQPQPRTDERVQRIVYESPRQDRYEYVDEHEYAPSSQTRYAQRIEYVPVRMSNQSPANSGRYFIAQAGEQQRSRAEYAPVEEFYDQGAVYERNGQLYRAAPRTYQTPLMRGSAGSPPSHSY